MARRKQECGLAGDAAGDEGRLLHRGRAAEEFGEALDMLVRVEGGGRPLGLAEADEIRRKHIRLRGEARVDL